MAFIGNHIDLILVLIVLVSAIPMVIEWWNGKRREAREEAAVEETLADLAE